MTLLWVGSRVPAPGHCMCYRHLSARKKTKTTCAAKHGEKRTLCMVVGDTVGAATVENSVEFPQVLNLELPTI